MAYEFKLEALLNYRRNLEEIAQQKLAKEQLVLENHKLYLESLRSQRLQIIHDFEQRKKKQMEGALFSFYMDGINEMERRILVQQQTIAAQEQIVETARGELQEKVKSRKVIERAREKDFINYMKEFRKKEQNEGDEQVLLRYKREMGSV